MFDPLLGDGHMKRHGWRSYTQQRVDQLRCLYDAAGVGAGGCTMQCGVATASNAEHHVFQTQDYVLLISSQDKQIQHQPR